MTDLPENRQVGEARQKTRKRIALGEALGGSGGVRGAVEAVGRSVVEGVGWDGGVMVGTRVGFALRGSVLSGKLFRQPSAQR